MIESTSKESPFFTQKYTNWPHFTVFFATEINLKLTSMNSSYLPFAIQNVISFQNFLDNGKNWINKQTNTKEDWVIQNLQQQSKDVYKLENRLNELRWRNKARTNTWAFGRRERRWPSCFWRRDYRREILWNLELGAGRLPAGRTAKPLPLLSLRSRTNARQYSSEAFSTL